jgi:ATP-dependent Clp protease ATP-binding subunit ClpC
LSREEITQIVDLLLDQVQERLKEQELNLVVTETVKNLIAAEGYDPDFGARPLRRVIQAKIEDALSEGILAADFALGDTVQADVEEDKIVFKVIRSGNKETAEKLSAPMV